MRGQGERAYDGDEKGLVVVFSCSCSVDICFKGYCQFKDVCFPVEENENEMGALGCQ